MQGYPDTLLWQHSFWLSISPQRNNQDGVVHTYTDIHGVTTAQAIFTQEQMDRVVEDLKVRTREINAETKRFVSDSEWLSIDQVGMKLRPQPPFVDFLRPGRFCHTTNYHSISFPTVLYCLFFPIR